MNILQIPLLFFTVGQIEGSTCTDYCGSSGREKVNGDNIQNVVKKYLDEGDEKSINCLDTSTVTDMNRLLSGYGDERFRSFNTDLSCWDVSKVTDMDQMFYSASSFNNDLSSWDVSSVTNMVVSK